jgi:hypothetical protein
LVGQRIEKLFESIDLLKSSSWLDLSVCPSSSPAPCYLFSPGSLR